MTSRTASSTAWLYCLIRMLLAVRTDCRLDSVQTAAVEDRQIQPRAAVLILPERGLKQIP